MVSKEIPNIENFPDDWELLPLSSTAKAYNNGFIDGDWIESPYIQNSGIRLVQTGNIGIGRFIDNSETRKFISFHSFKDLNCKWVYPDDILICRLADPIGRACIVPNEIGHCVTSVDCTIYRPDENKVNKSYVLHFLNSERFLKRASTIAGGSTRQRISRSNLGKMTILVPPRPEQRRIAEILDTIDEAIQKTEALISKLKAMKQGLLHDLLTRGLDKNGKLRDPKAHPEQFKDSLLGRIPKEWDVRPLGVTATLQRGFDLPIQDRRAGDVPIFGSNGIDGHHNESRVSGPGVITGRSGSIGFVYYTDTNFWPLNTTLYVKEFHGNRPKFIRLLLESLRLDRFTAATGVPSLNRNFVHPIEVTVPEPAEQDRIVDVVEAHDARIRTEEQYRDKLKLQKKGLMHDLLTGKVRVQI